MTKSIKVDLSRALDDESELKSNITCTYWLNSHTIKVVPFFTSITANHVRLIWAPANTVFWNIIWDLAIN